MKNLLRIIVAFGLSLIVGAASAQVTGTVVDTDSQAWANGSYSITFVTAPGKPGPYFLNGNPFTPQVYTGVLNTSGAFSVSIPQNCEITPSGSTWKFTISPNATSGAFSVNIATCGSTQDISTVLDANAQGPRFPAGFGAYGYLDVEISPIPLPGGIYWNVSTQIQRVWNGSSWQNNAGGGGGGTPGFVDTDPFIQTPPGNNGIFNAVNSTSCTSALGCFAYTPQTSTSTEVPPAYNQFHALPGNPPVHTEDYRGGADVSTFNSPMNPLAIVGAPNISGSFAGAYLKFMNQAVAVPGQTFPNYALEDTFENFLGPGENNYYNLGGPAFKTNYFVTQDNVRFFGEGQHNGHSINAYGFGVGDFIPGYQMTGWAFGSAGDQADEKAHEPAHSLQQAPVGYFTCVSGCTTGSTSVTLGGNVAESIGDGGVIQDMANAQPSSATGCHLLSNHQQGSPLATVTMAGTGCFGISKMFVGATPANAAITQFSITGNVVTFTASNTLFNTQAVTISGLSVGTYFNGVVLYVLSSSGTQFTAAYNNGGVTVGPTSDSGTATPYFAVCNTYQKGACGSINQAIATSGVPSGFSTSTAGLASSGVACVSTSLGGAIPGNSGDNFEMIAYTVVDGTHIHLNYAAPHPAPAVISIGGSCGQTLVPYANISGTFAQIATNGVSEQAVMIVGSTDGITAYLGNYAQITSVVGANSRVLYQQSTSNTFSRTSNLTTVTTTTAHLNGLTATVSGATPSSFNGTFTMTEIGLGIFTYPNPGANTTGSGGTVTFDYAEYALVPSAVVTSVMNPATKNFDLGNVTLAPNNVAFSAGPNVLITPPGSELSISGEGDFEYLGQLVPQLDYADGVYGSFGHGNNWVNPGPFLAARKDHNIAPSSFYRDFGGTAEAPFGIHTWQGVWSTIFTGDAPANTFLHLYCKPAPINCDGFNTSYAFWQLQQNDAGALSTLQYTPLSDTYSLFNTAETPVTVDIAGNLNVTGSASLPNLAFPNGIIVSPITTTLLPPPFNDDGSYNIAFKQNDGTIQTTLGLQSKFVPNGLAVGSCHQPDGNSPYCAPSSSNGISLAFVNSSYGSQMNGIAVGLGTPIYEPIATPLNVGTLQYGYILEGKTSAGLLTPIGLPGNSILTLTINSTNTVSIPCPATLQNGYPSGTTYELIRRDEGGGGGDIDLGTCALGTTFVDNGSSSTPATENAYSYTSLLGAGSILDASQATNSGNCVQWGAGGLLGSSGAPCGSGGGGGGVTSIGGSGGAFTCTGSVTCTGTVINGTLAGSGTVTVVTSQATVAPLMTTSVATGSSTPAISYSLSLAAAHSVFGNFTGSSAAPTYSATPVFSAAALTNFPTFNQNTTGNAATATNLASYPTLCSGGQFSQGLSSGSNNCATPSGGGSGTVTHTAGALTLHDCVIGNGAADIAVDPDCATDGAGNLTTSSVSTNGTGVASQVNLIPSGTSPATVTGAASLGVPNTVTTAGVYLLPAAPCTGQVYYTNAAGIVSTGCVSSSTATPTGGSGVTSVTCATATCTNLRGTYTVVAGTFTTGTVFSLAWSATPAAYVCTVTQNGGATTFGIGNSVATTTGMNITAAVSVISSTFNVNYSCQP